MGFCAFLNIAYRPPVVNEPIAIADKYNIGLDTKGMTNNPPCGACKAIPKRIQIAPANAPPITDEIMTRAGSAATKGNAPSEIKHNPRTNDALPAFFGFH